MFTEDDADRIEELRRTEIARWTSELTNLVGKAVEIDVDWESTYTLAPKLEPDFAAAGDLLIGAFRIACEDEETRSALAERFSRVAFTSVSPHLGFGCLPQGDALQFRTTVYPHAQDADVLPSLEEYGKWVGRAATEEPDPFGG